LPAQIYKPDKKALELAAQALIANQVIGLPTETVYGLAGNAFNVQALSLIFSKKNRPTFDPLIVHIPRAWNTLALLDEKSIITLERLSPRARASAKSLIAKFWPGPLTIILPKNSKIPDLVTSGLASVALRMPSHAVAQELLSRLNFPLAAPSANRFGRISPTSAGDVKTELGDQIEIILDGGTCEVGLESTIVRVESDGAISILRPGKIAREDLIGFELREITANQASGNLAQAAPGMLESHYAPKKSLTLLPSQIFDLKRFPESQSRVIGILLMSGSVDSAMAKLRSFTKKEFILKTLSPSGNWREAAQVFFSSLRELDDSAAEEIFSEPCFEQNGIGFAIADRLKRASATKL